MSLRTNASRLNAVTRDLSGQWQETRNYWRDAKSDEFHKKYLEDLMSSVDRAMIIMEKLDAVLAKIKKDCE